MTCLARPLKQKWVSHFFPSEDLFSCQSQAFIYLFLYLFVCCLKEGIITAVASVLSIEPGTLEKHNKYKARNKRSKYKDFNGSIQGCITVVSWSKEIIRGYQGNKKVVSCYYCLPLDMKV